MKREFKWAVILTVLSLGWLSALMFFGFQEAPKANQYFLYSGLFYVLFAVIYFLALADRRKGQRGYLTRRDGFLTGLIVTFFYVILIPLNVLVFYVIINPDFFNDMVHAAVLSGDTLQEAESQYNLWGYIANSMLLSAIIGGLISATAAFVLERQPQKTEA